jgi:hypothetical protein
MAILYKYSYIHSPYRFCDNQGLTITKAHTVQWISPSNNSTVNYMSGVYVPLQTGTRAADEKYTARYHPLRFLSGTSADLRAAINCSRCFYSPSRSAARQSSLGKTRLL